MSKPIVKEITKVVYGNRTKPVDLEEYYKLSNEEWMDAKPLSLEDTINKVMEINEEAESLEYGMRELKDVNELGDFLYDNDLVEVHNTYNDSWWGGTRQFMVLKNDEDKVDFDYPTIVFISYHRGGDVRGNYEKYEAFELEEYGYDSLPYFSDRLTYHIETDKGKITLDTEDNEGYYLMVVEDETGTLEVDDSTTYEDLGEKIDLGEKYKYDYGLGGFLLGSAVGGYVGYKIGRARPQKKGFDTEKKIAREVKKEVAKMRAKKKDRNKSYAKGGYVNAKYLNSLSDTKRDEILSRIANHYGTSIENIKDEVYDEDAEKLYEYIGNDNQLRMEVYRSMEKYDQGGLVDLDKFGAKYNPKTSQIKFGGNNMSIEDMDFDEIYNSKRVSKNFPTKKDKLELKKELDYLKKEQKKHFEKGGKISKSDRDYLEKILHRELGEDYTKKELKNMSDKDILEQTHLLYGYIPIDKYDQGGLTRSDLIGSNVKFLMDEIEWTRKPYNEEDVYTEIDFRDLPENIRTLISNLNKIKVKEKHNVDFYKDRLDGNVQFYVLYINEQPYLVDTQGYQYVRYITKIKDVNGELDINQMRFVDDEPYAKGGLIREYIKPKGIKLLDDDRKQKIKEAEKEYDRNPNDINQARLQGQIDRAVDEVENRVMGFDGNYESYLVRYAKGGIIEYSIQTENEDEHFEDEDEAREFWNSLSEEEKSSGQFFSKEYEEGEDGEMEEGSVEVLGGKGYAKGGKTERWIKTDGKHPKKSGTFVEEAEKRNMSVYELKKKALSYPTKDDFDDEKSWEKYKNSKKGKKEITLRKQAVMVDNMSMETGGLMYEKYAFGGNLDWISG